jgi:hypothetical protein
MLKLGFVKGRITQKAFIESYGRIRSPGRPFVENRQCLTATSDSIHAMSRFGRIVVQQGD